MNEAKQRPDAREARTRRGPTQIGDWVLHADLGVLRRGKAEVRLNAKTLHVLLVLLDAGDTRPRTARSLQRERSGRTDSRSWSRLGTSLDTRAIVANGTR